MLLNEFRKEIESLNEIGMGQYQLHIDEQMSKHVYTTMSYTRGVTCFPYVVNNKLMMLYCFTDLDLLRKFDRAMLHRTIERQCSLSQEVLLRLFENRVNYCDKLPLSESIIELALYYYKENLIDANYFNKLNKISVKRHPAGKLLSTDSLEDIKL
ncbi:hypothetical protein, partial [Paraclostridium bifermentans]|uniref:hypothetical protein n=1 Tax=Paraclostridium bifermentans TaxID=1490 RepID=UPI00374F751B